LTSNAGWDTKKHLAFLQDVVGEFQQEGIRVSIFVDTDLEHMEYAAKTGTDRVELYTEPYASNYHKNRELAIAPFVEAGKLARQLGLGLNAGHDLNLDNLAYLKQNIPWLMEVSIGHALIADALYLGLEETIKRYRAQLA
ncbi:MAG: pyridoxine 5'-phosphate synthase, partial [Bacteroidales bacterium]|nr:pyridoxine 5'-phosphate synthase [Bacteroidales bacterium]